MFKANRNKSTAFLPANTLVGTRGGMLFPGPDFPGTGCFPIDPPMKPLPIAPIPLDGPVLPIMPGGCIPTLGSPPKGIPLA